ncbi:transporter family [Phanerochaete sordida]|uniref:Transporter family n=1 Tax=Phanerochaete sordida TaxID=48140 RepID=A0A9P3GPI9_9APHY|nr:transporter family [Phanerochaete sordida]
MAHGGAQNAHSRAAVIGTVLFYLVAALAMVMANKWVLNSTDVPLFFLCTQLMIAVVLFLGAHAVGVLEVPLDFDPVVLKGLVPMVGLNVIGLSFSNYTLKYVDASFYQVARGMVLPFTVMTSYIFLHARPSFMVLFACSLVTFGFFIGVFLDGTPVSLVGISFGVASSMITAMHSVVIKKSLEVVKGSALHLSWYTNLFSAVLLLPLLLLAGEGPGVSSLLFGAHIVPAGGVSPLSTFLWGSAITGVFGFLMSIASLLSIKVTSPITHMVSSAVRGVAASILGVWLFHDIISTGRASSIATILLGSVFYTWVKHQESQQAKPYERVPLEEVEEGKGDLSPTKRSRTPSD